MRVAHSLSVMRRVICVTVGEGYVMSRQRQQQLDSSSSSQADISPQSTSMKITVTSRPTSSTPHKHTTHQQLQVLFIQGLIESFVNPRLGQHYVTKKRNLPIKKLKMKQNMEIVEGLNPRLAQILTSNPSYIWGSGVYDTPLVSYTEILVD